ncbi:MAG TPA: L-threonine 3-dehydrogenase [Bryobacteraceae bacterium]|nr:L-threonine 3-dehydrogenase [Bryobacteraceae bacterium]
MKALVKREPGRGIVLADCPVPSCAAGQVLIRILKTGVCGSDLHIYQWDQWASRRLKPPLIVGHEFVGRIEEVGSNVEHFRIGDLVSGEGHISCGHCFFCRTGQGHICPETQIIGVDRDGCFAELMAFPAQNTWKVHPSISIESAAIFDPFGNAMHSVMAQCVAGKTVAVVGVGSIGLMACQIAAVAGALCVLAIDPQEHKRKLAKQFGATAAFDPGEPGWKAALANRSCGGHGVDVVLEMSGNAHGIRDSLEIVRRGGEVALLGIPPQEITLNLSESIIFKALTVRGINGRRMFETWYQAEQFLVEHKVELQPLITHEFPPEEFEDAFGVLERGESVKVLFDWSR